MTFCLQREKVTFFVLNAPENKHFSLSNCLLRTNQIFSYKNREYPLNHNSNFLLLDNVMCTNGNQM